MRTAIYDDQSILDLFVCEKILTKKQLLNKLGCSWMTAWRLLKAQGYLTSYNNNACYYTLAAIPKFDDHGLWSYRKTRFSRHGTLTRTIVELVCHSTAGLYANELQQRLRVNVRPMLSRLFRSGSVGRHKLAGSFLYLDSRAELAHKQFGNRSNETTPVTKLPLLPEPAMIIALLVERIKNPNLRPELSVRRLRRKGLSMSTAQARAVFEHYELGKKKRSN